VYERTHMHKHTHTQMHTYTHTHTQTTTAISHYSQLNSLYLQKYTNSVSTAPDHLIQLQPITNYLL